MEASELARWTRFAAKGGIGKCTAVQDCVAEASGDLMFLKDDDITVLMQVHDSEDLYLGYCEGVVGQFCGVDVHFHSRLKGPVITKRSSIVVAQSPLPTCPSPSTSRSPPTFEPTNPSTTTRATFSIDPAPSHTPSVRSLAGPDPQNVNEVRLGGRHDDPWSPGIPTTSPLSAAEIRHSPGTNTPTATSQITDLSAPDQPLSHWQPSRYPKLDDVDEASDPFSDANHFSAEIHTERPGLDIGPLSADTSQASDVFPDPTSPSLSTRVYNHSEVGSRISATSSDGKMEIGLCLLQDMTTEMNDWLLIDSAPGPDVIDVDTAIAGSTVIRNGASVEVSTHDSNSAPLPQSRLPYHDRSSTTSNPQSSSSSGDYWEDIYDDYRYSRQSFASKMSRSSQNSARTSSSNPPIPALPVDASLSMKGKSSVDSNRSFYVQSPKLLDLTRAHTDGHGTCSSPNITSHNSMACLATETPLAAVPDFAPPIQAILVSSSTSATIIDSDLRYHPAPPTDPVLKSPSDSISSNALSVGPNFDYFLSPRINQDSITSGPIADHRGLLGMPNTPGPALPDLNSQKLPQYPSSSVDAQLDIRSGPRLFLPHPNAPKPTASSPGPMYARAPANPSTNRTCILEGSAIHTIRMAATEARSHRSQSVTIYGICKQDLTSSSGPVPVSFSLESPPTLSRADHGDNVDREPKQTTDKPSPTLGIDALSARSLSTRIPEPRAPPPNAIPRPNFSPNAPGVRPRSRSFCGFDSSIPDLRWRNESRDKGHGVKLVSSISNEHEPSKVLPPNLPASQIKPPLSMPGNNSAPAEYSTRLSAESRFPSPLRSSYSYPPLPPTLSNRLLLHSSLRKTGSSANLNDGTPSPSADSYGPLPESSSDGNGPSSTSSLSPSSPLSRVMGNASSPNLRGNIFHQQPASQALGSVDIDAPFPGPSRIQGKSTGIMVGSSSSSSHRASVRSKLSLPNLRGKNGQDDASHIMPVSQYVNVRLDHQTVQVQDTDFELIYPNISRLPSTPTSDQSLTMATLSVDMRAESANGCLRADSPTFSISSAENPSQLLLAATDHIRQNNPTAPNSEASMDAHRQRELKWMSLMSSVPASHSRTNKKFKKLLLEGVPSSVRFLVWAHLTNSKAREVPGVYSQLAERGRTIFHADIERDVQMSLKDNPRLQGTRNSLCALLKAYLTMVPDIQYGRGLTFLAGHLLLLCPEEDAFWILVSMMDAHLRPYFSSNIGQIEVDASLFSKALETLDPPLSRKIFFDLGVNPSAMCKPWFSYAFSASLPMDYLHRVWDLFLHEGITFLFRVGLTLLCCCRRQLLQLNDEKAVFQHLRQPPPTCLPPTADAFISLVYSVKLKDGQVRKQRVKMEAQLKRQTQAREPLTLSSLTSPAT